MGVNEQVRDIIRARVEKEGAIDKLLAEPPIGTKKYRGRLNSAEEGFIKVFAPIMGKAMIRAENDKTGKHGIRSVKTKNPDKVLMNSIYNNFVRWRESEGRENSSIDAFVDFMGNRGGPWGKGWAPIGAVNDPNNKNKNWVPNVQKILLQTTK